MFPTAYPCTGNAVSSKMEESAVILPGPRAPGWAECRLPPQKFKSLKSRGGEIRWGRAWPWLRALLYSSFHLLEIRAPDSEKFPADHGLCQDDPQMTGVMVALL